jgi:hypothetical protein
LVRFVRRAVIAWVFATSLVAAPPVMSAQWRPGGITPTPATLADVLAVSARAAGSDDPRLAQRREHWTYIVGPRRIPVSVAVRGADYRTSLELDGLNYTAGRRDGAHWRGDGNGMVHGVEADLQGDALDRAPQAVFAIDPAICTLVGEARLPAPAWVIATHPDGDKPVFLYVDEGTGSIVREVMRDGKRVVTIRFDNFAPFDGAVRARHWHIVDGNTANTLDVTVDAIEPGVVGPDEVAFPDRHPFAAATPLARSQTLDSSFRGENISIKVDVAGRPAWFILDCGTTSITVDPSVAARFGVATLEHAVLPQLAVGPLHLDHVSVLTVPFWGEGLLGFDFFFGHVIEIDYPHRRVRVLSDDDARATFADPKTTILTANVDQGLPLVRAGFGPAQSNTFAIDTGSAHLYVMDAFMAQFADEIARHWTPAGRPFVQRYLEGGIELQPYRVARFDFGGAQARDLIVGGQVPTTRTDDLAIPFDGIIGTDILANFDLYFDYDHGRLGLR